jgi:pyruvyltransferase
MASHLSEEALPKWYTIAGLIGAWYTTSALAVVLTKELPFDTRNASVLDDVMVALLITACQLVAGALIGRVQGDLAKEQTDTPEPYIWAVAMYDALGSMMTTLAILGGGATITQIIKMLEPLMTVILAYILFRQTITVTKLGGVALSCVGVTISSNIISGSNMDNISPVALLVPLSMVILFPLRNLYAKKMDVKGVAAYALICEKAAQVTVPVTLLAMLTHFDVMVAPFFGAPWFYMGACVFNAIYNFISFAVLKHVTALTHAQLRLWKRVFSIIVSMIMLRDLLPSSDFLVGCTVAICGLSLYSSDDKTSQFQRLAVLGAGLMGVCLFVAIKVQGPAEDVASLSLSRGVPSVDTFTFNSTAVQFHDSFSMPSDRRTCMSNPIGCTKMIDCGAGSGALVRRESYGMNEWKSDLKLMCSSHPACSGVDTCMGVTLDPYVFVARGGSNFGDEIGLPLIRHLAGGQLPYCHGMGHKNKLLGQGSTIHHMCQHHEASKVVIWGTGGMQYTEAKCRDSRVQFDVRAVRGYRTLDLLQRIGKLSASNASKVAIGDPSLLLPHLYPNCAKTCSPPLDVCVVLHKNDEVSRADIIDQLNTLSISSSRILSVKLNPSEMLEDILGCRLVLSSSLNGLIFAEAFGVPARWLILKGSELSEGSFKYEDYYTGTRGRDVKPESNFSPVRSIREGIEKGGARPFKAYDTSALIKAFPRDGVVGTCAK